MHLADPTDVPLAARLEVVCEGDPRAMGVAQGERLRDRIHGSLEALTRLEAFQLQKPKWMPHRVFRQIAQRKSRGFLATALAEQLPTTLDRLSGLAIGARIRPDAVYLLNAMEAVLSDLSRTSVVPVAAACSALAVSGSASRDRQPILAHNFDYLPAVRPFYLVRECRPAARLRSLEFTAAPLGGAVDGMNEAGLCITYNYAYAVDAGSPAPTLSMRIAEALSLCRNVPEATEYLSSTDRWGGGLLMLGDADGRIAALEISNTKCVVREPAPGSGVLHHTNRFQDPAMKDVEIQPTAIYSRRAPRALRDRRVHQSAEERDRRFAERVRAQQLFNADAMLDLMSDHGPDGTASADSICMHSDYWHTTACIQFFPQQRRMRVAYESACRARFAEFQL